jgi:nucleoside-diphosphate-sugar epimerase
MIYGNERDANMHKLIRVLRHAPAFPVFGPGTALMQPVFVDDLAEGIVEAVIRGVYGEYNLAGPVPLSYRTLLQTTMEAIGRRIPLINLEHRLAATIARGLQRLPGFPVKHEQVMRLMEDKAFDISAAQRDIAYQPRPFADGIAEEALRLREIGWI